MRVWNVCKLKSNFSQSGPEKLFKTIKDKKVKKTDKRVEKAYSIKTKVFDKVVILACKEKELGKIIKTIKNLEINISKTKIQQENQKESWIKIE